MQGNRYRIRFVKQGPLRWIGHLDLVRLWERLLRRAKLNLKMTEGFHPKPKMNLASAMALGCVGLDEVIELELLEDPSPDELAQRLRDDNQPGLEILQVLRVPAGTGKAKVLSSTYNLCIAGCDSEALRPRIESLLSTETIEVERKKKVLKFTVAQEILRLEVDEGTLVFTLASGDGASIKPTDIIDLLNLNDIVEQGQHLTRTRIELANEIDSNTSVTEKQPS